MTDFRLGVVDKIEYRDAANALVGTDDFTYNDLLQRTSGTGRYEVNSAWTYDDRGRMLTESNAKVREKSAKG